MSNVSDKVKDSFRLEAMVYDADPVSMEILQLMELAFGCVLIHLFALLGLAGATINIIVLSSQNITTDSSNILLISLSVADFVFCLTIPICRFKCIISHLIDIPTGIIYDIFIQQHLAFFNRVFYYISITLVGAISAERFLVVFFPLKVVSIVTPSRIRFVSVSVYAINFALASPGFFCLTETWLLSESYNRTLPVLVITEFYKENIKVVNVVISLVYNNTVLGVSILLSLTCTPAIAVKLWIVTQKRQKMIQKKCSFDLQVAKILIAICTVSLLVYGPFVGYITATYFIPDYKLISNSFNLYSVITDFSGTICASANFLIYVTMSSKFRKHYTRLFSNVCICK
ncbi:mas-related G-protein coupled receptor member D-like [Biomphalaria glabrata]|uniref:Mas-related G-protein coupled receptor member D-like n=1 Tax=Biomphalaria glabrata TaxID=6526 RepID=A0A9W2YKY7_BIOGL|nr:mas-related G-protein coupled receptor member D-like [Biomphalaria glabrata]